MQDAAVSKLSPQPVTRRALLQGAALGLAAAGGLPLPGRMLAQAADAAGAGSQPIARYNFQVVRTELNPDGAAAVPAVTVNGTLPGPEIRVREGDLLRIEVANRLADETTSIHWHGLLVPSAMDGVPDLSQDPIAPRQVFVYEYPIRQSGTYWYHSHVGLQEQIGLLGAFIIEPRREPLAYDRDYVVMLSDWLHADPYAVLAKLRGQPQAGTALGGGRAMPPAGQAGGMAMGAMKMDSGAAEGATTMGGSPEHGMAVPMQAQKAAAGGTRPTGSAMGGADLADVDYNAFLLNGRGNHDPWTALARPGERVRLRVINAGSATFFRFMVDGHPLIVSYADGNAVRPVEVDNLLIGMAETYDLLVTVRESGSFTIRAEAQDGSGQAIGVLHTSDAQPKADLGKPRWGPRQLAYGQLQAAAETTLAAGPPRAYGLDLTGDMMRYVWSINDQVYPRADPLVVRPGERAQVTMTNRTGMWHPMHLHGHFFRLLPSAGDQRAAPLKHTVALAPQATARIEFLADNPGRWFFHCHNLYHLEAGMARAWVYET
jgi:multicopper oxidase